MMQKVVILLICCGLADAKPTLKDFVDPNTPKEALKKKASTGEEYELVFSDEFAEDNRRFFPGDDDFFEAVDLHYWQTSDLERYHPDAAKTRDGRLIIEISKNPNASKDDPVPLRSAMLQSWNKFCFQGGLVEFRATLPGFGHPGEKESMGYWPGLWFMGNLGRAGYGATTDGVWPFSYDTCDWAVNQSMGAALPSGNAQRINACVEDPGFGLNAKQGRGAPEIDVLEGMVAQHDAMASQSFQVAPFSEGQTVHRIGASYSVNTKQNPWLGSAYQQAASANTMLPESAYGGAPGEYKGSALFSVEFVPGPTGYIKWSIDGQSTWTMDARAVSADEMADQRLIPEEPMYFVMNLASGRNWGDADPDKMVFPAEFAIDYVRLYQPKGKTAVSCDPASHPTAQYIKAHPIAYNNAGLVHWSETNYSKPNFTVPATNCPKSCAFPHGRCAIRTGTCMCLTGWGGESCTEAQFSPVCMEALKNVTCEAKAQATDLDIQAIFEYICDPNSGGSAAAKCADFTKPQLANCSSRVKAAYVMTEFYNHFKAKLGQGACSFNGVGTIVAPPATSNLQAPVTSEFVVNEIVV